MKLKRCIIFALVLAVSALSSVQPVSAEKRNGGSTIMAEGNDSGGVQPPPPIIGGGCRSCRWIGSAPSQ